MWLPWQWALFLAAGFFAASVSWGRSENGRVVFAGQFANEATVIAVLYAAWIFVGRFTLLQIDGAIGRAETLWDIERLLALPDEARIQEVVMAAPAVVKAANIYYGGAHVPAMGIFLIWFFMNHRDQYPGWRNSLAVVTALCVAIQLLPVAPPRLVPSLGMIDTGIHFDQSVFEPLGSTRIGQLQAMPSIHVAWAGVIAAAMWANATGWLRWVGVGHLGVTAMVVVVTANHYWMDGIAALALLVAVRLGAKASRALIRGGPSGPATGDGITPQRSRQRVG